MGCGFALMFYFIGAIGISASWSGGIWWLYVLLNVVVLVYSVIGWAALEGLDRRAIRRSIPVAVIALVLTNVAIIVGAAKS